MGWGMALLAGLVCGLVGAVVTAFAGDAIVRLFRISNFEGGAGYAVAFLFIPLGFVVGLATGTIVTRLAAPNGLGPYALYLLLGTIATCALLAAGYGLFYLGQDRPPRINGQELALEAEVRVPLRAGETADSVGVKVSLQGSGKDNQYLEVDAPRSAESKDSPNWIEISASGGIYSHCSTRTLSIQRYGGLYESIDLPLAASPSPADTAWSEWMPSRWWSINDPAQQATSEPCQARWRIRIGR
ncbi:MAG: hypothetical protein IT349_03600 [Candidatus Eisenbacteria bacterium]|nr:hypothetical protein [Candidatus Eisenbacteria bacterium]